MDILIYPLLVLTGFVAGFINTLAGAGSVLSLAVLNLAGLPLDVANGTKRVAILFQTLVGVNRFQKQGKLQAREHLNIILPSVAGAIIGAQLIGQVTDIFFRRSVGVCMAVVLFLLLFNPQRWIEGNLERLKKRAGPGRMIAFFLIGVYGGYIQVGVGVFMLSALVLVEGLDLVRANAIKILLALCFTVPALLIFVVNGQVRWDLGLALAAGSMLGAWAATYEAAKRGAPFIRKLLLVVVSVAAIQYLFF